jgi:hypothetical protein
MMSNNPPCPRCGNTRTHLHGLANQNYPASYVCHQCDVYGHYFAGPNPSNDGYPDRTRARAAATNNGRRTG